MGNGLYIQLTEPSAGEYGQMSEDQPDTQRDDEFEVTDLPRRSADRQARVPRLSTQTWQRLLLALSLVLLAAVLVGNVLYRTGVMSGPSSAVTSSNVTSSTVIVMPSEATSVVAPTPAGGQPAPTVASSSAAHAVGPAPAQCSAVRPTLTGDGNPSLGLAIGTAPVLLGGFSGPYATLPIGPAASARESNSGWDAPYTQYGWPAFVDLILHPGVTGPVTLSGWNVSTGYPLWFGLVEAGVWGAPQQVTTILRLDPARPAIPEGGTTSSEDFWYGYVFLPGSSCYQLSASWPGGNWQLTVSAGAAATVS